MSITCISYGQKCNKKFCLIALIKQTYLNFKHWQSLIFGNVMLNAVNEDCLYYNARRFSDDSEKNWLFPSLKLTRQNLKTLHITSV